VGLRETHEVQQGQVQGPAYESGQPRYQYRLGDEDIESSPAEKDLGVLVSEKLDMSQQWGFAAQLYAGLHQEKCGQQVEGGDSAPLFCSGKTSSAVLHPPLEPPQ